MNQKEGVFKVLHCQRFSGELDGCRKCFRILHFAYLCCCWTLYRENVAVVAVCLFIIYCGEFASYLLMKEDGYEQQRRHSDSADLQNAPSNISVLAKCALNILILHFAPSNI